MDTPETLGLPVDQTQPESPAPTATTESKTAEKKGGGLFGWLKNPFAAKPKEDAGLTGNPADAKQDPNIPPAVPEGLEPPLGVDPKEISTRAGVDTAGVTPTIQGLTPDAPTALDSSLPAEATAPASNAPADAMTATAAAPGPTTSETTAGPNPDKIEVFK